MAKRSPGHKGDGLIRAGVSVLAATARAIGRAVRARPGTFAGVALGVFALNIGLPLLVLSVFRKPVDHFTFNPWLSRLPEWLASDVPFRRKLEFLSELALAWFSADNPVEGVEWGFIIDVPSLARFLITSLLFGAYFALWLYRRDQVRQGGWGYRAARYGGAAGAVASVLGFSTGPCSVMGCGVPVLPVVGLALTGLSSGALTLFSQASRIAGTVVLVAMILAVAYLGWLVGATAVRQRPPQVVIAGSATEGEPRRGRP